VLVEGSATRGEPDVSRTGPRLEANPRPTHDQIYLLHSINERSVEDPDRGLTPGNVYGWNRRYGVGLVTSVLRTLHGFPPLVAIKVPYRYVSAILAATEGEPG
jgi:hypothetical protein